MPSFLNTGFSQLLSLGKSTSSNNLLKYPSDLFSPGAEPFVIFTVYDSIAKGAKRRGAFAMYMPPSLKVRYNAQYEEISLDVEKWLSGIANIPNFLGSFEGFVEGGARAVAEAYQGITGANSADSFDRLTGKTVNPHMGLNFRGAGLREFQLDFHLMAKNASESASIQSLIYQFKYFMSPDFSEGQPGFERFMLYPENFSIAFFTPKADQMFAIQKAALTNVEVDYAGSGVPSFFSVTGAPVDIRLSLQFKELSMVTKKEIRENKA